MTVLPNAILRVAQDIKDMKIRGAGLIASSAIRALDDSLEEISQMADSADKFFSEIRRAEKLLLSTRPTAVALPNAISFVDNALIRSREEGADKQQMMGEIRTAINEFLCRMDRAKIGISEAGVKLIPSGASVMTHCHSTVVVSLLRMAAEKGLLSTIYVKETRPLYQGLTTARQLSGSGADVRLIVDSASAFYMDRVDMFVVGADAIALNGDLANKIGTFSTAIVAKEFKKKVLVAAETYKIALIAATGKDIPIEFRSEDEVLSENSIKESGLKVLNPSFDITPHDLIDYIVTEMGVLSGDLPSQVANLAKQASLIPLKPF